MYIPDFSEFVQSVDIEKIGKEIDAMNPPHIIQFDSNDKQALENAITLIYQQAVSSAVKISMLNLQSYHEWLQKQLE